MVANAMKDWRWKRCYPLYPLVPADTRATAEKMLIVFSPVGDGKIIMGSQEGIVRGEPDASSFERRTACYLERGLYCLGYYPYAFIKDKTLCIPTAFCSYAGEALDKRHLYCAPWRP